MSKPKLSQETMDRIHREAQELRDRVMSGNSKYDLEPEKKVPRARKPRVPKPRAEGPSSRRVTDAEVEEMIRVWNGGEKTLVEVGKIMNITPKTIATKLKDRGLWEPGKDGTRGRPKGDICSRGHSQAIWRSKTPGDLHCTKCKADRNAKVKKEKRAEFRDNRVVTNADGSHTLILEGEQIGFFVCDLEVANVLHEKLQYLSHPKRRLTKAENNAPSD